MKIHQGTGRTIHSATLLDEWRAKELTRRNFISRAALAGGAAAVLPGCDVEPESEPEPAVDYLVGMGSDDSYNNAVWYALQETVARDNLAFIEEGATVYLKVNSNSGDWYPYSTRPRMVELVGNWALEQGAGRVIVGDRSFWGDNGTLGNLTQNGIVEATEALGDKAELVVFDANGVDWVAFEESDAPDWVGGFRYPLPVVEADVIINLPIVKTHFISQFTMGMKNLIGLVHEDDRKRPGNLYQHSTAGNLLYRQIAQLNQYITPNLTLLDGWEAVTRGGPTINDGPGGLEDSPGVIIASTDRIAADVMGLAILKEYADSSERLHNTDVWDNPQIVEAVAAGVGVDSLSEDDISGETVADLADFLAHVV